MRLTLLLAALAATTTVAGGRKAKRSRRSAAAAGRVRGPSPTWISTDGDPTCSMRVLDASALSLTELAAVLSGIREPVVVRGAMPKWESWPRREEIIASAGAEPIAVGHGLTMGVFGPEEGLTAGATSERQTGHMPAHEAAELRKTAAGTYATTLAEYDREVRAGGSDKPELHSDYRDSHYVFFNVTGSALVMEELETLYRTTMELQGHLLTEKGKVHTESGNRRLPSSPPFTVTSRVAVGPTGAGLPFHKHEMALNAIYRGSKQWYVFNPTGPWGNSGIAT